MSNTITIPAASPRGVQTRCFRRHDNGWFVVRIDAVKLGEVLLLADTDAAMARTVALVRVLELSKAAVWQKSTMTVEVLLDVLPLVSARADEEAKK